MVAHVTLCGLLCYVAVLASGDSLPRAMLYHFSPYGVRAISIFYQFIQFLGATVASDGEVRITFISSFHLFADLAKHPAGQLSHLPPAATYPARPLLHRHPSSRGGRPVSAKPIGKQKPEIYLPISSPSLTSKHSNRSRKNAVAAIFAHDDFHRCRATSSSAKI